LGDSLRKAKLDQFAQDGARVRAQAPPAPAAAPSEAQNLARVREQAYQEGLAAGREEATAQSGAERAVLKRLAESLQEVMQDFEQGLANDVLSMSLELAKLIVRHAVRVKPELVLSVVREAVNSLSGLDQHTTLHLHPADAALLREIAQDDPAFSGLPWTIVEDHQIERGGCRLETATTEVDATLETRWRRLIASLGREDPWIDITL
jgi:flagellar assembly protein FliH